MGNGERLRRIERLPADPNGYLVASAKDSIARFAGPKLVMHPGSQPVAIEPIPLSELHQKAIGSGWNIGFHTRSVLGQVGLDAEVIDIDRRSGEMSLQLVYHGREVIETADAFPLGQIYLFGEPLKGRELAAMNKRLRLGNDTPRIDKETDTVELDTVTTIYKHTRFERLKLDQLARGPDRGVLHEQIGYGNVDDESQVFEPGVYLTMTDDLFVPQGLCLNIDREQTDGTHGTSTLLKPGYEHPIVVETLDKASEKVVARMYKYQEK